MQRIILVVFLFCSAAPVVGQMPDERLQFTTYDEKYSWRKASQNAIDSFYYDLQPVERSTYPQHIRFSSSTQIVDLYKTDKQGYEGMLTNTITEYRYEKNEDDEFAHSVPAREVFEHVFLDTTLVKAVIEKLVATGQPEVPTDSLIPGWSRYVLHCNGFSFEYKINGVYSAQDFICPWGQKDTIPYKKVITSNIDFIYKTLRLDTLYKSFEIKLPPGKIYSSNGYTMMYINTEQQMKYWAESKPRRDYTYSVKDSVDNYLNKQLALYGPDSVSFDCYFAFSITFGKNGKLKRYSIHSDERIRLSDYGFADYFDEKRTCRKCKAEIRRIFRRTNLGFINGGYEIYRTIQFSYGDRIELIDETIY